MSKTKHPVFKCLHRGEKGFTLIELIIVVAIIGVLAAVVAPNVIRFLAVGEKGAAEGEMRGVQTVVRAAMAEVGVGAITGGNVTNTTGVINTAPRIINLNDYLDGGIARLRGNWVVNATGWIVSGSYPNREHLPPGANYWAFTAPDTWERRTR